MNDRPLQLAFILKNSLILFAIITSTAACSKKNEAENRSPAEPNEQTELEQIFHWQEIGTIDSVLTEDQFTALARDALGRLTELQQKARRVNLAGELAMQEGSGALLINVRVDLAKLPFPIEAGVAATGPAANPEQGKELVKQGLTDTVRGVKSLLGLIDADRDRLVRALLAPEPDEQLFALKLLGFRKSSEAISAIAKLLVDPRLPIVEAAAEALAQIGDERAVPLLIGSIRRSDLRSEVRAIEAMGRIGGKEAEAYLEMTAMGHEVEEVRVLSRTLLKNLKSQ